MGDVVAILVLLVTSPIWLMGLLAVGLMLLAVMVLAWAAGALLIVAGAVARGVLWLRHAGDS